MVRLVLGALSALVITSAPVFAQDTGISADMGSAQFSLKGQTVTIERTQDPSIHLDAELSKASRACPPSCVTPMQAAANVSTVGELELIDFLKTDVSTGQALLLDTRTPDWYAKGSIPGALNVPSETLDFKNPYRNEIFTALGGVKSGEGWDFSGATKLMLFCNGPWSDQSPRTITGLLDAGYPAEKISYYRGGIQVWKLLGLNVTGPTG